MSHWNITEWEIIAMEKGRKSLDQESAKCTTKNDEIKNNSPGKNRKSEDMKMGENGLLENYCR